MCRDFYVWRVPQTEKSRHDFREEYKIIKNLGVQLGVGIDHIHRRTVAGIYAEYSPHKFPQHSLFFAGFAGFCSNSSRLLSELVSISEDQW